MAYQVLCICSNKGVVLLIVIYFGVTGYFTAIPYGDASKSSLQYVKYQISYYVLLFMLMFSTFFGWIADAWIGRYKTILYGLYTMLFGGILVSIWAIILNLCPNLNVAVPRVFLYGSNIVNSIGYSAVTANLMPFITDQLIGASSNELSSSVHWYYWGNFLGHLIAYNKICVTANRTVHTLLAVFIAFSGLGIALCSIILGKHWLDKTHKVTNPIKHIAKVLNYARKNKYPENRSALTYWEHDIPSRVDLGKQKYGGPFTEEEVENVKTALRLIPLIFVTALFGAMLHVTDIQRSHMMTFIKNYEIGCFIRDQVSLRQFTTVIAIPFYHFIVRPAMHKLHILNKCSLSLLKWFGVGIVLKITGTIGMVCIEMIGHLQSPNATCMFVNYTARNGIDIPINISYYWALMPLFIKAVANVIVIVSTFEFIIAQSPQDMKGLLFGLWYAFDGAAKLVGFNLYRVFQFDTHLVLGCGFYYYLTQTVLMSIMFAVFLLLSKNYKLRVRNVPVNIHLIAETHIIAYMNQERQYNNDTHNREHIIQSTTRTHHYGATNPLMDNT